MRDATSRAVTDKEAEEDAEAEKDKDKDIYEIGEYEIITTTKQPNLSYVSSMDTRCIHRGMGI